jgi:large subunit ribosomal protein L4e
MKIPIVDLKNRKIDEMELPRVFETPFRPDVIKRAVITQQSHRFQPQGRDPMAGKRTTAEFLGTGLGISRIPRVKGTRRGAFAVGTVGGRRAFPPTSEKRIRRRINKKERWLAIKSAIAATALRDVVAARGHIIDAVSYLPIIVDDEIESLRRTKEVRDLLINLGVWPDVERADRRKIRAGKGKMRGRKRKVGKGPLIVVSEDRGIGKASANLPGVDVVKVTDLNTEVLAPGAHPGRLVIWSRSAFEALDKVWGEKP